MCALWAWHNAPRGRVILTRQVKNNSTEAIFYEMFACFLGRSQIKRPSIFFIAKAVSGGPRPWSKGEGGGCCCLACPAGFSSFCDLFFFTPNKVGGRIGGFPPPPLDPPLYWQWKAWQQTSCHTFYQIVTTCLTSFLYGFFLGLHGQWILVTYSRPRDLKTINQGLNIEG